MDDADRKAIEAARRWLRFIWLQGHVVRIDALERDGIEESMRELDALAAKLDSPVMGYTGI
jgi:hypothetical protein